MSFNTNCGERLREERDRLKFTQQEMADRMGVRREMSSKYERGQAVPGGDALTAFAIAGGDVQYVLTGKRSSTALTADEQELLAGYRDLDVRGKANMLGMLDVVGTTPKPTASVKYAGKVKQVVEGDQTVNGPLTFGAGEKRKKKTLPE